VTVRYCGATDKRCVKSEGFAACAHPRTRSRGNEVNKSILELKDARRRAEDSSRATERNRTVLIDQPGQPLLG
jgi:hypothetical protein